MRGFPTASLDLEYGASLPSGSSHAMDLTTTVGMSLLNCQVNVVMHMYVENRSRPAAR